MRSKELVVPMEGPIPDGTIIRALRYHLRLTTADLAKAALRSPTLITQVETGNRPSHDLLDRLSGVFGKPADELRNTEREQLARWLKAPKKPTFGKVVYIQGINSITSFPPRRKLKPYDGRIKPEGSKWQPVLGVKPESSEVIPNADIVNTVTGQKGKLSKDKTGRPVKDEEGLLTIEFPDGLKTRIPESLLGKKYQHLNSV